MIENRAAELQNVDGIGPKRRERIANAWQEAKQVQEIMLFLHTHGVSTSRAVRIFKTYGDVGAQTRARSFARPGVPPSRQSKKCAAIPTCWQKTSTGSVSRPPTRSRRRSGFRETRSTGRGRALIMLEATSDGHCALPLGKLKLAAVKLLEVPEGTVE